MSTAELLVAAIEARVVQAKPPGVDEAYVRGFFGRYRAALVEVARKELRRKPSPVTYPRGTIVRAAGGAWLKRGAKWYGLQPWGELVTTTETTDRWVREHAHELVALSAPVGRGERATSGRSELLSFYRHRIDDPIAQRARLVPEVEPDMIRPHPDRPAVRRGHTYLLRSGVVVVVERIEALPLWGVAHVVHGRTVGSKGGQIVDVPGLEFQARVLVELGASVVRLSP